MTEPRTRMSSEVAARLDISPSTLRRWTVEFADFLTEGASAPESQFRRYADDDVELLVTVKALLSEGYTYYQVGRRLEALQSSPDAEGRRSLAVSDQGAAAFGFLTDTLHTVADGQQLLLGSQQATRDLLGVLLQDNFTLKDENAKLRDRMLNLERELTEFRRHNARHHRVVEDRLERLETDGAASPEPSTRPPAARGQATPAPSRELPAEPKGCLAALLGVTE